MSSDQQVNVHISGVTESCENKPYDNQQCENEKCSMDTENVALDKLTAANSGIDPTRDVGNVETVRFGEQRDAVINHNDCDNVISNNVNGNSTPTSNEVLPVSQLNETNSETLNETTSLAVNADVKDDDRVCSTLDATPTENLHETTENEPPQEKKNEIAEVVNGQSGKNQISDSMDDNEIEPNDETSDDEGSNAHDSNDDSNVLPEIVDFDGTNEVENDEYILDTVLRKPRKERRRIVSVNDDESDQEMNVERERLLQSPTTGVITSEDSQSGNIGDMEEDIELLIRNEKPGPKSKKVSTQKLKELQARELLRNAVVIPSSSKKKKSRIIDSDDDEENSLVPYCVDVDDIGLPDTTEDNDNENDDSDILVASGILLNEIDKPDELPIENSNQYAPDSIPSNQNAIKTEPNDENSSIASDNPKEIKCPSEMLEQSLVEGSTLMKLEQPVAIKTETTDTCDSVNSTDIANQQCKMEVDSQIEDADFPPFPSSSSSDNEDEFIPNHIYFGTPDNNIKRKSGGKANRGRGRSVQSTPRQIKRSRNVAQKNRGNSQRGRRSDNFIDNRRISSTSGSASTSSSESEDEYHKSKARRKPETITIVKQPSQLYHKVSLPVRPIQKQQQIQRQNHRKHDRFYDKSQDIPNAIYFGEVDVPLHVLYAYGDSDSDTPVHPKTTIADGQFGNASKGSQIRFSSQVSRGRGRPVPLPNSKSTQFHTKAHLDSQKARGRPKVTSVSPSNDRSIQMMKKCLKAAGLKKVKLNRLWEGCKSNSERAEKMLELLREKGLEGEPTIAKCKQLKVDYLTKKEIEDLDPNLIIQTEGRTRRSTRAATKRQYTYDEDEILETRTKLRKVIDSDSDFE